MRKCRTLYGAPRASEECARVTSSESNAPGGCRQERQDGKCDTPSMTENTTDRSYPKIVVGQFRDKMRRNFAFERAPMNASTQGRINSWKNNVERTHIGRFFFAFRSEFDAMTGGGEAMNPRRRPDAARVLAGTQAQSVLLKHIKMRRLNSSERFVVAVDGKGERHRQQQRLVWQRQSCQSGTTW